MKTLCCSGGTLINVKRLFWDHNYMSTFFFLSSLLYVSMAALILTPSSCAVTSERVLCVARYIFENRCYIFLYIRDGELMHIHTSQTLYRRRHHQHHPQQSNYYYMIYISSWLWCTSLVQSDQTQTSRINEYISMDFSRLTCSHLCGFF